MSQEKPTILVVADDAIVRMHAVDLLEDNGFGVVEAANANADAALKLLETRDDVRQMPRSCDGKDLARQMQCRHIEEVKLPYLRATLAELENGRMKLGASLEIGIWVGRTAENIRGLKEEIAEFEDIVNEDQGRERP
jgi:CheY-like chemotaxis protein